MTIGQKINILRTKAGLSQETFAKKLGVSRQSVSKWEKGEASPDLQRLIAISGLFSVTVDSLVKEDISVEENESKENKEAATASTAAQAISRAEEETALSDSESDGTEGVREEVLPPSEIEEGEEAVPVEKESNTSEERLKKIERAKAKWKEERAFLKAERTRSEAEKKEWQRIAEESSCELDVLKTKRREDERKAEILRKISVAFIQSAAVFAVLTLIGGALALIFQNYNYEGYERFYVATPISILSFLIRCGLLVAAACLLSHFALGEKRRRKSLIFLISAVNAAIFLCLFKDVYAGNDIEYGERTAELLLVFERLNILYLIGVFLFDLGAGILLALSGLSIEPSALAPAEEKEKNVLPAVAGLVTGLFATPILWPFAFIAVSKIKDRYPKFSDKFFKFLVIGMIAFVVLVVAAYIAVYVASKFAK